MSLSAEEKSAILANWKTVTADKKATGVAIFCKLIEMNPSYQKMFRAFKDMSFDEMTKSPQVRVHGLRVVNAFDQVILALESDPNEAVIGLKLIGESHGPRGVRKEHFERLNVAIDAVLKDALKGNYAADAWSKLLDFATPVLAEAAAGNPKNFV